MEIDHESLSMVIFPFPLIQDGHLSVLLAKYGHLVVPVNSLEDLSLPRNSVVRLTDRPFMTIRVDRGH